LGVSGPVRALARREYTSTYIDISTLAWRHSDYDR